MKTRSYKFIIAILIIFIFILIRGISLFYHYHYRYCSIKVGDTITIGNNTRPIDELKSLVLFKGDTRAYEELCTAYLNEEYDEEFLIYSLFMANKYNHPRACYYVYHCLTSIYENHHNGKIDKETKTLALKYLSKGVELGDPSSLSEMGELYINGKYVPKDTILGEKLLKKISE